MEFTRASLYGVGLVGELQDHRPDDVRQRATKSPIVPREKDRGAVPIGTLHDRVDETGDVHLPIADERGWVFAILAVRHDPDDAWQFAVLRRVVEFIERLNVAELSILAHSLKVRQGIPDLRRAGFLRFGRAEHRVVFAVGLSAFRNIVRPTHIVFE